MPYTNLVLAYLSHPHLPKIFKNSQGIESDCTALCEYGKARQDNTTGNGKWPFRDVSIFNKL